MRHKVRRIENILCDGGLSKTPLLQTISALSICALPINRVIRTAEMKKREPPERIALDLPARSGQLRFDQPPKRKFAPAMMRRPEKL